MKQLSAVVIVAVTLSAKTLVVEEGLASDAVNFSFRFYA
jgi:hypothetical protein